MRHVAFVSLAVMAVACGSTLPGPPPAVSTAPDTTAPTAEDLSFAPIPYTAAQIREACTGRTMAFRVEAHGKAPVRRTIRFLSITPNDTETESVMTDDEGRRLGEPTRERARWDELRKHGAFPKDKTTITTDKVTTPAGTFATHAYKVVGEDGAVTTFQFADDLPGPPVSYFTEKNGVRVVTATMIATSRAPRP